MANTSLFLQMMETQQEAPVTLETTLTMLGHSIGSSFVLVLATFLASRILDQTVLKTWESEKDAKKAELREILGAVNLLFLSVGVTGMMLLINNSLFRAFALLSAIALVKFRVKIDNKALNASLLFGVLAGISCGVREPLMAWTVVGVYIFLTVSLLTVIRVTHSERRIASVPVRWLRSILAK